jgi:hypothetical protein
LPDLLHECWGEKESGEFGRVNAHNDLTRAQRAPHEGFLFEIWAPSWHEAMRLHDERAYGEFGNSYDHMPDTAYTEEDAAEQRAYLARRPDTR